MRRIALASLVFVPLACFKAGDDSVADEATSDSATEASTQTESGEASTSETTTESESSSSETTTTTETGALCGNGVIDEGEQCDGAELGGFSCTDLGYPSGTLACDVATCTYDASGCSSPTCGWDPMASYYDCGFAGEDPGGTHPITCPDGLVEGDLCASTGLTGEGCCDANNDNWYCTLDGVVFFLSCG